MSLTISERAAIIGRIADGVAIEERRFMRSLGEAWIDSYLESWAVFDETYNMLAGPDRPAVLPRPHMIRGTGR